MLEVENNFMGGKILASSPSIVITPDKIMKFPSVRNIREYTSLKRSIRPVDEVKVIRASTDDVKVVTPVKIASVKEDIKIVTPLKVITPSTDDTITITPVSPPKIKDDTQSVRDFRNITEFERPTITTSSSLEHQNIEFKDRFENIKGNTSSVEIQDIYSEFPSPPVHPQRQEGPDYDRLPLEHQQLLKVKFVEAFDQMKTKHEDLTPEYNSSMSLQELHKRYNSAFDQIEIKENVKGFKTVLVFFWIALEYVIGYFGYDISGYTKYQKESSNKTFDEYIISYCKLSYQMNNTVKMNPNKITFSHEGTMFSMEIGNDVVPPKLEEPSLSALSLNIGFSTFANIIGFIISKYLGSLEKLQVLSNLIKKCISEAIEYMTSSSRKTAEAIEYGIESIIPPLRDRFWNNPTLQTIIDNIPSIIEFAFGNAEPAKAVERVKNTTFDVNDLML